MIATHPRRYTLLSGYRFFPLWFNWLIPEAGGRHTRGLDYLMMLEQGLLGIAAAMGLRWKGRDAWPLCGSIALVCLAYMAVNSQMRFVVPLMPLTVVLAALGARVALQHATGSSPRDRQRRSPPGVEPIPRTS